MSLHLSDIPIAQMFGDAEHPKRSKKKLREKKTSGSISAGCKKNIQSVL